MVVTNQNENLHVFSSILLALKQKIWKEFIVKWWQLQRLCSLKTDSNSKEAITGESVVVNYVPNDFQESNFFYNFIGRWIINSQAADKWWIIC